MNHFLVAAIEIKNTSLTANPPLPLLRTSASDSRTRKCIYLFDSLHPFDRASLQSDASDEIATSGTGKVGERPAEKLTSYIHQLRSARASLGSVKSSSS
jgi:hypothetical protein